MANIHVLELKKILETVQKDFPGKSLEQILSFLNTIKINQKKFKFVFTNRFYIQCPKCKNNKLILYRKDNSFKCRECWKLKYKKVRKKNNSRGKIYSKYVRPLEKLQKIEKKLFEEKNLSDVMRAKLEKKAAELRKALPEYMQLIRHEIYKVFDED